MFVEGMGDNGNKKRQAADDHRTPAGCDFAGRCLILKSIGRAEYVLF